MDKENFSPYFFWYTFSLEGRVKMKNSYFHLLGCLLRQRQKEAIETEHLYFTKEEFKSLISLSGKLKRHQGVSENKDYKEQSYEGFHDMLSFGSFSSYFYVFVCEWFCVCARMCVRVCVFCLLAFSSWGTSGRIRSVLHSVYKYKDTYITYFLPACHILNKGCSLETRLYLVSAALCQKG